MVELSVRSGTLDVNVIGWAKLWALKSRLRVPIERVRSVRHDPEAAHGRWKGWRMPGTYVPGVITAGTYYGRGKKSFWYVRRPERVVVVELEGATYDRLVVEVENPVATVGRIEEARRRQE